MNAKGRRVLIATGAGGIILALAGLGLLLPQSLSNFQIRNLHPDWAHPFGTDNLGRDLFLRSLAGLSLSLWIGLLSASLATAIALGLALVSGLGRRADAIASFITDAMLALPHLMLLILISCALGGGAGAVIGAVALSHWPRLARILRAEVMQLQAAPFVQAARGFGKGRAYIFCHHMLPHLWPQALVGLSLTFPHAILHEAGLSFLGFGLEPSRPALGVMLSEAMGHLSGGRWWLAFFPGLMLLGVALLFEVFGRSLYRLYGGANVKD